MCLILNGYWVTVVWISRPNSVRFLFVGFDEQRSLQKKDGVLARIFNTAAPVNKREDQCMIVGLTNIYYEL